MNWLLAGAFPKTTASPSIMTGPRIGPTRSSSGSRDEVSGPELNALIATTQFKDWLPIRQNQRRPHRAADSPTKFSYLHTKYENKCLPATANTVECEEFVQIRCSQNEKEMPWNRKPPIRFRTVCTSRRAQLQPVCGRVSLADCHFFSISFSRVYAD